jgi:hypothetical protein
MSARPPKTPATTPVPASAPVPAEALLPVLEEMRPGGSVPASPQIERPTHRPDAVETVLLPQLKPSWTEDEPRAPASSGQPGQLSRSGPAAQQTWVGRGVLAGILCVQAALSLRLHNTAFEDEALYLYSGHMEIVHWLHGVSQQGDYAQVFSGAPVLYPVLGALAVAGGGLAAARQLSLLAMLATTVLLYALTRRLFNEQVAVYAAALFSVTESAIFLGNFATYDAPAICLLALATWIVVRTASWRFPGYLLAAPVAVAAVADKYAALLFVPTIVVLSALAAVPYARCWALIRPAGLGLAVTGLLYEALRLAGPAYRKGIEFSTLSRAPGTTPTWVIVHDSLLWGGLPFTVAVIGAVAYARRPGPESAGVTAPPGSWFWRTALVTVLTGTALLAPAEQIHLHTYVSLQKHIGFGLFFAAPVAGVGLARIIGDHFRRVQIGIAVWVVALTVGMSQATELYASWPNSAAFVSNLARDLKPGAHYLVEDEEVPIFYLLGNPDAQPNQFTSTYYIGYTDQQGKFLTGTAGYAAAIRAGYFQVVSYNGMTTPGVDRVLTQTLEADPGYRLQEVIPQPADHSYQYIWVKAPTRASHPASAGRHRPRQP